MKIMICGRPGSGKSTLATKLGIYLDLPVIYLDNIFLNQDRSKKSDMQIEQSFTSIYTTYLDGRIIEGNYLGHDVTRLEYVDYLFLLNTPRIICLYRLIKRLVFRRLGYIDVSIPIGAKDYLNIPFYKWMWTHKIGQKLKKTSSSHNMMIHKVSSLKEVINIVDHEHTTGI